MTTALPCSRHWDLQTAIALLERHMAIHDYDEEAAHAFLLATGCPPEVADAAWWAWAMGACV